MSLVKKLSAVQPIKANTGCETCQWLSTLPDEDRDAIDQWIADGFSVAQLHEICSNYTDNPIPVTDSAFRNHLKRHTKP